MATKQRGDQVNDNLKNEINHKHFVPKCLDLDFAFIDRNPDMDVIASSYSPPKSPSTQVFYQVTGLTPHGIPEGLVSGP